MTSQTEFWFWLYQNSSGFLTEDLDIYGAFGYCHSPSSLKVFSCVSSFPLWVCDAWKRFTQSDMRSLRSQSAFDRKNVNKYLYCTEKNIFLNNFVTAFCTTPQQISLKNTAPYLLGQERAGQGKGRSKVCNAGGQYDWFDGCSLMKRGCIHHIDFFIFTWYKNETIQLWFWSDEFTLFFSTDLQWLNPRAAARWTSPPNNRLPCDDTKKHSQAH